MVTTAEQIRAARAALRWEQRNLAERSGVSLPSIKRLEGMDGPLLAVRVGTLEAIRQAFEDAGITFIADGEASADGGPGVRLDPSGDESGKS